MASVILFGSLATGAAPHERTGVDLAVPGLSEEAALDVVLNLEDMLGAAVDLVRLESASPRLAARVADDGVEVP